MSNELRGAKNVNMLNELSKAGIGYKSLENTNDVRIIMRVVWNHGVEVEKSFGPNSPYGIKDLKKAVQFIQEHEAKIFEEGWFEDYDLEDEWLYNDALDHIPLPDSDYINIVLRTLRYPEFIYVDEFGKQTELELYIPQKQDEQNTKG